jgi:hypothetical protein
MLATVCASLSQEVTAAGQTHVVTRLDASNEAHRVMDWLCEDVTHSDATMPRGVRGMTSTGDRLLRLSPTHTLRFRQDILALLTGSGESLT